MKKTLQYREAWLMSKAHKWHVISINCIVLGLLMILTAIKYQGINYEYKGAVRYIGPVSGQVEAEAYENLEKGTTKLIKIK
jgi:hypothetical protein